MRSPLTAANVKQLGGSVLNRGFGGGGGATILNRREYSEISMLRTEVVQLNEEKQHLVDENRDLKIREDKALRDRDEMQRKLEAKEADLKRVREHIDAEIQHRKGTDSRLRESSSANVLHLVTVYIRYTSALNSQNLCQTGVRLERKLAQPKP